MRRIADLDVPRTFPMYLDPFGDDDLSMAARGVLATIRAHRSFYLDVDEDFYERHKGPVQELIKKGYMFEHREFGDDFDNPEVDNPLLHEINSSPYFINEEINSKEYAKILSDAVGFTWDTKVFCVHHINHNRKDNRVENLLLLPRSLHSRYHYYEFQTKKLREELSYEMIPSGITIDRNKLFTFIYLSSDIEEMLKVQKNIISMKKYCDEHDRSFNSRDLFLASNKEILQKYIKL